MKEPCRFYSLLLPIKQHEALQKLGRKGNIPIAKLIRKSIANFIKNPSCKCEAIKNENAGSRHERN